MFANVYMSVHVVFGGGGLFVYVLACMCVYIIPYACNIGTVWYDTQST